IGPSRRPVPAAGLQFRPVHRIRKGPGRFGAPFLLSSYRARLSATDTASKGGTGRRRVSRLRAPEEEMNPRFRVRLSWLTLALFALVPIAGSAQTYTPYSISMRSQQFQPLPISHPQAGPVQTLTWDYYTRNKIDFPIRFFDEDHPTIYVSMNGFIEFANTTNWAYSNTVLPSTSGQQNGIIAPWWDDFYSSPGTLKAQVLGQPPSRTLVLEWTASYYYSFGASMAQFQVWLFEGSSTIEFHYGEIDPVGWTASMGIENIGGT